jgi:hypothetical protein
MKKHMLKYITTPIGPTLSPEPHVQGVLAVRGDFWSGDMADYPLMLRFAMMKPVVEVCRGDASWRSRCIGSVLWPTCP